MKTKFTVVALMIFILGVCFYKNINSWEKGKEFLSASNSFILSFTYDAYSPPNTVALEVEQIEFKKNNKNFIEKQIIEFQNKKNILGLINLYEKQPDKVIQVERASILVARALMHSKNIDSFNSILNAWSDRETLVRSWFCLKADKLIYDGKLQEAEVFLNSKVFAGKLDSGRLLRLAIVNSKTSSDKSWANLRKAVELDSKNADIRTFQAQILEASGMKGLAQKEYVAAYLSNPGSPILKDRLADFYRRNGNFGFALKTWAENISNETPDFIKLKAYFWNRVYKPWDINFKSLYSEKGEYQSLFKFLNNLTSDEYWNKTKYKRVSEGPRFVRDRQEVFWLRLIEELEKGRELKALSLLEGPSLKLKNSWQPELQTALHWILAYRNDKSIHIKNPANIKFFKPNKKNHQFYNQLFSKTRIAFLEPSHNAPDKLKKFLESEDVFSAAFLASGWVEMAIQFNSSVIVSRKYPDWYAYGLTQAYRYNRGNEEALEFSRKQNQSDSMRLLAGEILLSNGQIKEARNTLETLASLNNEEGYRSAWLLSQSYLSTNQTEKAKQVILKQTQLAKSVNGKTVLAEIYLSRGNIIKAEEIYSLIVKESPQAKVYFAKKYFREKDYLKARRYTESLALEFPAQLKFIDNLRKLDVIQNANEKI